MRVNYTKIVATLGPSSDSSSTIENMVQAGMDVARLNFSHGSYKNFKQITKNIRKAARKHKRVVGLIQDLQGPKIRLGILPTEGIEVKKGQKIILTTGKTGKNRPPSAGSFAVPVQYKNLHKDVKKGHTIFIDDGMIELKVTKVKGTEIYCTAKNKGTLYSNKGINAPDSSVSAKTLTPKDIKDLTFGLKTLKVDYIALSFVKSAKDIKDLRALIARKSGKSKNSHQPKIIAKIERKEAVTNLEEIVKEADGVMVARGDLAIEIQPEHVPVVQKSIIRLANIHAKPVITATQVLASMVENITPTRAEISDAANAIYDNSDAIMLSNESAVGAHPVKAVRTLAKVISAVENEKKKHQEILQNRVSNKDIPELNAACLSACELAVDSGANQIVIYSEDGYTARQVVKHRVFIPTTVITPNPQLIQELSLVWGLNKAVYKKVAQKQSLTGLIRKLKLAKKGTKIVAVSNTKTKGNIASFTA